MLAGLPATGRGAAAAARQAARWRHGAAPPCQAPQRQRRRLRATSNEPPASWAAQTGEASSEKADPSSFPPPQLDADPDSDLLRPEYEELSDEQIEDLVDAAASLISVLPELRPLDRTTYNAAYEVWRAIAAVPPSDRYRILEELDPGAIRNLWKCSVGRYALDEARAAEIYENYQIWMDLPTRPGEVFTYAGTCEKLLIGEPGPGGAPGGALAPPPGAGASPWLAPAPGGWSLPQRRFTQRFFVSPRTGRMHSRVALHMAGPLETFWAPIYNTVQVGLALTPVEADAGADLVISYPWSDAASRPLDLDRSDLPSRLWPKPRTKGLSWSPFSRSGADYVRVAGPGVLVGCAYGEGEEGGLTEDGFVFFAMARVR